jgi:hypothetical protein
MRSIIIILFLTPHKLHLKSHQGDYFSQYIVPTLCRSHDQCRHSPFEYSLVHLSFRHRRQIFIAMYVCNLIII